MAKDLTFQVPPSPTGIYTVSVGKGGSGGTFGAVGGGTGSSGILNNGSGITKVSSRMVVDHEITGQTITASYQVSHAEMLNSASTLEDVKYGIKKILIGKIAEKLFESNMIEFTQQEQVTEDATMFRARIHVTPDTQVRVIRELKDAGKTT
jgi:hypothetical protein